jgi:chorismate mutase
MSRRPLIVIVGILLLVAASAAILLRSWGIQGSREPAGKRETHTESALDELLDVMRQRLLLMHEVARWKWNEGKPITDREREQQLLADIQRRAIEAGISGERIREFMAAQIEAGKLIQEADFADWKKQGQGKFVQTRDLHAELRPRIDELNDRLLALLKTATDADDSRNIAIVEERARAVLVGEGIDDAVRAVAIRTIVAGAN